MYDLNLYVLIADKSFKWSQYLIKLSFFSLSTLASFSGRKLSRFFLSPIFSNKCLTEASNTNVQKYKWLNLIYTNVQWQQNGTVFLRRNKNAEVQFNFTLPSSFYYLFQCIKVTVGESNDKLPNRFEGVLYADSVLYLVVEQAVAGA